VNRILILLKNGFEEIEALTPLDILRRLNYDVKLISMEGSLIVKGSHGVNIEADLMYDDSLLNSEGVIIPGGMPGALNLKNDDRVIRLVKNFYNDRKLVAAICAGPIVLGEAKILNNHSFTCYPGFEKQLNYLNYLEDKVVVSENIITSRGPSTAFVFAFEIAKYLNLDITNLLEGMLFTKNT